MTDSKLRNSPSQESCINSADGLHVWKTVFIDNYTEIKICRKCSMKKGETF